MPSTIPELTKIQRDFDARHSTRGQSWAQEIDEGHISVLLELTVALAGEVGEFANNAKKVARGDFQLDAARPELASELADIFIYVLKLSSQLGIDLESAFREKLHNNEKRFRKFGTEPEQ